MALPKKPRSTVTLLPSLCYSIKPVETHPVPAFGAGLSLFPSILHTQAAPRAFLSTAQGKQSPEKPEMQLRALITLLLDRSHSFPLISHNFTWQRGVSRTGLFFMAHALLHKGVRDPPPDALPGGGDRETVSLRCCTNAQEWGWGVPADSDMSQG